MNLARLWHLWTTSRFGDGGSPARALVVTAVVGSCVTLWGCGPKVAPGMIPVTGQVTLAGTPLQEAAICFKSDDNGFSNTGRISAGTFRTTLKPGSYAVAVIAQEELFDERGISKGFRQLIPVRYFTTTSSGLTATVDSDHRTVVLDLTP